MTPNEKLVWAAAFAIAVKDKDLSPRFRAAGAVRRLRNEFDPGDRVTEYEAAKMIEEMRRDA